ncbi:hypothetical protein UF75_3247 [Desulfosporosinus sp. I2]|uniref:hypothetical protein n=1 Tax=Desulfosporosinus sp. I2 TaxID=1617025 RepID=UPI0005ED6482|nr:hypothetical protein [Desulfosporosinus sp. I2]KJR46380.1 hypothetical protein UF75_3247 [Desulfosporosinus sp. I2]
MEQADGVNHGFLSLRSLKGNSSSDSYLEGPFKLLSDHVSNFAPINGNIPKDKPEMLETIDRLLAVPENYFRQVDSRYL